MQKILLYIAAILFIGIGLLAIPEKVEMIHIILATAGILSFLVLLVKEVKKHFSS